MNKKTSPSDIVAAELQRIMSSNPHLSLDELRVVADHKMEALNDMPLEEFCGISPNLMQNWVYAPMAELQQLEVCVPEDVSRCFVMRCAKTIIDYAIANNGKIKLTPKGNLTKGVIDKANEIAQDFTFCRINQNFRFSEFMGRTEDKFTVLHYTHTLLKLTKIMNVRKGYLYLSKSAAKRYQTSGINAFYFEMLETAIYELFWGYLDGYEDDETLQQFWVFMVWRIMQHQDIEQLCDEFIDAFPDYAIQFIDEEYQTVRDQVISRIHCRFISRFLQYWGFINYDHYGGFMREKYQPVIIQPLAEQTFKFAV